MRGSARIAPRILLLAVLAMAVLAAGISGMRIGSSDLPLTTILGALTNYDGSREHVVILAVRLPRVLAGILAGAALAVAGAIMQAVTQNPLASPGLLGINAGAAFAVVIAIVLTDPASSGFYVWCAFAGAGLAAVLVYGLGSMGSGGASPLKLALAGAIVSAFLASLTTAILIFNRGALDAVRLWSVGTLSGRSLDNVVMALPYIAVGLAAALAFSRQITTMSLGSDVARSLGQNLPFWRAMAGAMVVLLAARSP